MTRWLNSVTGGTGLNLTAAGQGGNPPVNTSGSLADGRTFNGPAEFKQLLAQDVDRFAEAFVEQLATYALRRVMTTDDAAAIKAIAQASQKDGYRLRTVLENFVMSDLFQKRSTTDNFPICIR